MAEYNLNKMNRKELLELLLQQISDNEKMREQIKELKVQISDVQKDYERQLADRRIELSKAGSMAEAALRLNRVFADADLAVQQYQENIKKYSDNAESMAKSIKDEANREAATILTAARNEAEKTKTNARISAQAMLDKAKQDAEVIITNAQKQASRTRIDADKYQKDVKEKMTELYSTYKGLQSIMGALGDKAL